MSVTTTLTCSGGQWSATVNDNGSVTTISPLLQSGSNLTGSSGSVSVTIANPCPGITAAKTYYGRRGCCGKNSMIFGFGDPEICTGTTADACGNLLRLKVECTCCQIPKWAGPGWYCVRAAGGDGSCVAVELSLPGDGCNPNIEICSGPYAYRAAAEAVCPGSAENPCCPDGPIPTTLTLTWSTENPECQCMDGDVTLVYDPDDGMWHGLKNTSCDTVSHYMHYFLNGCVLTTIETNTPERPELGGTACSSGLLSGTCSPFDMSLTAIGSGALCPCPLAGTPYTVRVRE